MSGAGSGGDLMFFGGGHGAVGYGDLPVGVVGVEGFHGADDLLAEGGFDQVALAGPDFETETRIKLQPPPVAVSSAANSLVR